MPGISVKGSPPSWLCNVLGPEVPVLPVGALTFIEHGLIGGGHEVVPLLLQDTLGQGLPVFFAQLYDVVSIWTDEFAALGSSKLTHWVEPWPPAQTFIWAAPALASVPEHISWYLAGSSEPERVRCTAPSLPGLEAALSVHEARHGPSLVVLDAVDDMRPFTDLVDLEGDYGLEPQPPKDYVDYWQAQELRDFAERRAETPTVVRWEHPGYRAGAAADICDQSQVHVQANSVVGSEGRRHLTLHVSTRDCSTRRRWGTAREVTYALDGGGA